MCHDWPVKITTVNLPIRLKENLKPINFQLFTESKEGPEQGYGTAPQMLLTESRLDSQSVM